MTRIRQSFLGLVVAVSSALSGLANTVPYTARVTVPAATIQSGPSSGFYATDTLPEGTQVEVYREEAGGWCAVRPPESSFSWVYGRHVREIENSLGEITKDDVASRIGSRLSDKRNAVQIRLMRKEVVQIVGKEKEDGETWYRIAPPAGEFRWIHMSSIARVGDIDSTEALDPEFTTVSATTEVIEEVDAASSRSDAPDVVTTGTLTTDASTASDAEQWRPSATPATTMGETKGNDPAVAAETAETLPSDGANSVPSNTTAAISANFPAAGVQPNDIARRLAEIELRLSRDVAGPPSSWNLEALERETESLLAQAQNAEDRQKINSTLTKLDRFAMIERRYARSTQTPPNFQLAGGAANTAGAASTAIGPDGTRYDAVGVLRPVVSKRHGAPQYALVDERGQVVSFVTPTPDVNLQPFLGYRVGIAGSRGFIPEFNRAHVTAGRVAPLADRLVR